jgi:hypothetical protein
LRETVKEGSQLMAKKLMPKLDCAFSQFNKD